MSKFGDLLGKKKETLDPLSREQAEKLNNLHDSIQNRTTKQNIFANLKKTVADQSSAATAGEDTFPAGVPSEVSSPKPFKFNLGKSTEVASATPPADQQTGVADSMQETVAPTFSEKVAAKDFQSPDQPDQYTDVHVVEFKQSLDILKNSISNKELVSDALKNILTNLKKHTFLNDLLLPEDCGLMVASLRESYGVTIAKKQTKKTKRDTTAQDVDQVLDQLADVDISI